MSNLSTPSNDFPFLLLFVDSLVQNPCCLNMRMHYLCRSIMRCCVGLIYPPWVENDYHYFVYFLVIAAKVTN